MKKKEFFKGFTLIELLAVIVILGILLIIAIPQMIKVINNSRANSWADSAKLVARSIELNTGYNDENNTNSNQDTISSICTSNTTNKIKEYSKVDNVTATCQKNGADSYLFTLTGTGSFNGYTAPITCTGDGQCTVGTIPPKSSSSYRYDGPGAATSDSEPWVSDINSSWNAYLRNDGTNTEVCGKFSNGTACVGIHSVATGSDFADIFEAVGATCSDYSDEVYCYDSNTYCEWNFDYTDSNYMFCYDSNISHDHWGITPSGNVHIKNND